MKKILITGAAGLLGISVIKYLINENKYEITALDLMSKKNIKNLKLYQKRINIIYGDITNETLIEALVKDHDVVIHLASSMPPLCNIKKKLCEVNDYHGSKNIIDAINLYNKKCHLIFTSSTSIYGENNQNKKNNIESEIKIKDNDHYSFAKLQVENLIVENLKNYNIFRLPIILVNDINQEIIYHVAKNQKMELIKANDAALAIVKSIEIKKDINKNIYNLSGGKDFQINTNEYIYKHLEVFGLTWKYIVSALLLEKNYYQNKYSDGTKYEEKVKYITSNINNHFKLLKEKMKYRRIIRKILAKPIIAYMKKRERK